MSISQYVIGGIVLEVRSDFAMSLPASYCPFVRSGNYLESPAGVMHIVRGDSVTPEGRLVAKGFNDLGVSHLIFDGSLYSVGISPCPQENMRYMTFSSSLRGATLTISENDPFATFVIDSMLRIFFAQVAVLESSLLVHASVVASAAGAHMFLGKSGTGKSTHSLLWLRNFSDCSLINDDNPLVRLGANGSVFVHGTPWSGKTKCWRNVSAPVLSMTRLCQSDKNVYHSLSDVEALTAVIPSVSAISHCRWLYNIAIDTISSAIEKINVGMFNCLPDDEAARICRCMTEQNSKYQ